MENIKNQELVNEWEEAFAAADKNDSPTFSETLRVSNQPFPELIEDYLSANPDLNQKEVAFLEKSIEMKRQNQKSREEDMATVSTLREEYINSTSPEVEESSGNEKLTETISALQEGIDLLKIDPETQIRLDNENSDMWKKKYQFTDKEASKIGVMGLLFGTAKHRIEFYEMLGGVASQNGIDMNEERSVADIMSLLKEKAK